ncbi:MAG: hypothetical protein PHX18_04055 [Candidatus Gastranaerophilales bacterium]|nr:hypothetical protein [Candidatus Gastranaerophilales bacterium]
MADVAQVSNSNWFSRRWDDVKSLGEKTGVTDLGKSIYDTGKNVVVNGANIVTADAFDLDNNGSSFDIFGAVGSTAGDAIKGTWNTGASVFGVGERAVSGALTGNAQSHIADTLKGNSTAGIMGYFGSSSQGSTANTQDTTNQAYRDQVKNALANTSGTTGTTANTAVANDNTAANNTNQSSGGILGAIGDIFSGLSNLLFGGGKTQAAGTPQAEPQPQAASSPSPSASPAGTSSLPTAGNPTTGTEAQTQVNDIETAIAREKAAVDTETKQAEASANAYIEAQGAETKAKEGVATAKTDVTTAEKELSDYKTNNKPNQNDYKKEDGSLDTSAYNEAVKAYDDQIKVLEGKVKEAKDKLENAEAEYTKAQATTKEKLAAKQQDEKELQTAKQNLEKLNLELPKAKSNLEKFQKTDKAETPAAAPAATPAAQETASEDPHRNDSFDGSAAQESNVGTNTSQNDANPRKLELMNKYGMGTLTPEEADELALISPDLADSLLPNSSATPPIPAAAQKTADAAEAAEKQADLINPPADAAKTANKAPATQPNVKATDSSKQRQEEAVIAVGTVANDILDPIEAKVKKAKEYAGEKYDATKEVLKAYGEELRGGLEVVSDAATAVKEKVKEKASAVAEKTEIGIGAAANKVLDPIEAKVKEAKEYASAEYNSAKTKLSEVKTSFVKGFFSLAEEGHEIRRKKQ